MAEQTYCVCEGSIITSISLTLLHERTICAPHRFVVNWPHTHTHTHTQIHTHTNTHTNTHSSTLEVEINAHLLNSTE